jgi:predicted cobalt transporter CbtA
MIRTLLIRGMLVGAFAGLLAFGFASVFGEPSIDASIAIEEANAAAADDAHAAGEATDGAEATAAHSHSHGDDEEDLVRRSTQAGLGLFTGVVVYGAAIGGIFALVFAFTYGRVGPVTPQTLAAALALIGFVVIILVPQMKYPANPPAVGHGETIGYRTALFMLMLVISIAAAAVAAFVRARYIATLGAWNATLAGAAAFLVVIAVAMLVLPVIDEVPDSFPATLLWQFRLAALGTQAVLWTTIGLAFGTLAQRALARTD